MTVHNTWQPIETAPEDGSAVLGCSGGPWTDWWSPGMIPQAIRYRAFHPNAPGKLAWRNASGKPVYPTHWMPLPEPPK